MKVLHIASWYPNEQFPFEGDFIERQIQAIAAYTDSEVIYLRKDDKLPPRTEQFIQKQHGNVLTTICYYGSAGTGIRLMNRYLSFNRYRTIARSWFQEYLQRKGMPDLVHVHVGMAGGIAALDLKKRYYIPFVVTEHSTIYHRNAEENLQTKPTSWVLYLKKILDQSALVLPVTKHLGELIKRELSPINYQVISNVVDTSLFYYQPKEFSDVFKIVHVSGLTYQKNPDGILDALNELHQTNKNWHCTIVGPASETLKLRSFKYGLTEHITWAGEIPYEKVAAVMQQSHCLVLFSRFENQPCVLMEALCCGLPVITTNVGGISEVVDASNGMFVETERPASLCNAIVQMMERYTQYNQNQIALQASQRYNYNRIGKEISDTYHQVQQWDQKKKTGE